MAGEPWAPEGLIAARLDHLFRRVHPEGRGPYTPAEVADAINSAAGERMISATYKHLIALSRFFGVSPAFFFDETELQRDYVSAETLLAMRLDHVRETALRSIGLSERALKAVRDMVENARTIERLDDSEPVSGNIDGTADPAAAETDATPPSTENMP